MVSPLVHYYESTACLLPGRNPRLHWLPTTSYSIEHNNSLLKWARCGAQQLGSRSLVTAKKNAAPFVHTQTILGELNALLYQQKLYWIELKSLIIWEQTYLINYNKTYLIYYNTIKISKNSNFHVKGQNQEPGLHT